MILNLKNIDNSLINKDLPILNSSIIPQVGYKLFDYSFDYTNNVFIHSFESDIVDYIINNDMDLLFGKGHFKLNKKQETLISAGRMKIENGGKITYIDNDSGHYNPNKEHLEEIINILNKLNLMDVNYSMLIINRDNSQ